LLTDLRWTAALSLGWLNFCLDLDNNPSPDIPSLRYTTYIATCFQGIFTNPLQEIILAADRLFLVFYMIGLFFDLDTIKSAILDGTNVLKSIRSARSSISQSVVEMEQDLIYFVFSEIAAAHVALKD